MSSDKEEESDNLTDKSIPEQDLANSKQGNMDVAGDDVTKELAKIPEPIRSKIIAFFQSQSTFMSRPFAHPLFEKFTPEHISSFLEFAHQDDINDYKLKSSNRIFHLCYILLFIGLLVFLIVYLLPNYKEVLFEILKILVIFTGGFGIGYGYKIWKEKR